MDAAYDKKLNCLMGDEALEEFVTFVTPEEYKKFFKHLEWLDNRASEAAFEIGDMYFGRGCDPELETIVEYLYDYLKYFTESRASKFIEKILERIENKE